MAASVACDICAETLNKTSHRPVECPRHACRRVACASCVERYLLGLMSVTAGQCMHCRVEYDPMWLRRVMTASFMSGPYKRHREHVMLEHEKSLIPRTMPIIESSRRLQSLQEEENALKAEMTRLRRRMVETGAQIRTVRRQHARDLRAIDTHGPPPEATEEEEGGGRATLHYLRPCAREDCPGYVNSRTGHCAACDGTTCVKCNIPLPLPQEGQEAAAAPPHECLQVDMDQWNLIRSSTRPCPGCRTRITKATGCDQMWCPQCHTAFRWSTGEIERGAIHNPHYYEWMFGGRAPAALAADGANDQVCVQNPGQLPGIHTVRRVLEHTKANGAEGNETRLNPIITTFHQKLTHFHHTVIPTMRNNVGSEEGFRRRKTEQRLLYLTHKMSKEVFQAQLFRLDKAHRKAMEYNRILETFGVLAAEAFHGFCRNPTTTKKDLVDTLTQIRTLSEEGVRDINSCYKSHLRGVDMPYL